MPGAAARRCQDRDPPESPTTPQRLQVEGQSAQRALAPAVIAYEVQIDPPALDDLRADTARLEDALRAHGAPVPLRFSPAVLGEISTLSPPAGLVGASRAARAGGDCHLAARGGPGGAGGGRRLHQAGGLPGRPATAAKTLAKAGVMNPQIAYGEDVVSRIAYADSPPRRAPSSCRRRLVETLNQLGGDVRSRRRWAAAAQIVEAVVVGNTAMHHLVRRAAGDAAGRTPPTSRPAGEALDFPAAEIGLELAPGAQVYLPPNIAGYVGADHVADAARTRSDTERNDHPRRWTSAPTPRSASIQPGALLSLLVRLRPGVRGRAHPRRDARRAGRDRARAGERRRRCPPPDHRPPAAGGHLRLGHPRRRRRDAGPRGSLNAAARSTGSTRAVRRRTGGRVCPRPRPSAAGHGRDVRCHPPRCQRDPAGQGRHPRRARDLAGRGWHRRRGHRRLHRRRRLWHATWTWRAPCAWACSPPCRWSASARWATPPGRAPARCCSRFASGSLPNSSLIG